MPRKAIPKCFKLVFHGEGTAAGCTAAHLDSWLTRRWLQVPTGGLQPMRWSIKSCRPHKVRIEPACSRYRCTLTAPVTSAGTAGSAKLYGSSDCQHGKPQPLRQLTALPVGFALHAAPRAARCLASPTPGGRASSTFSGELEHISSSKRRFSISASAAKALHQAAAH